MSIRRFALVGAFVVTPFTVVGQSSSDCGKPGDGASPQTHQRLSFKEMDKDRSGSIEKDETTQLGPDLMKKMDFNSDSEVSETEFDMYQALTTGGLIFGRY